MRLDRRVGVVAAVVVVVEVGVEVGEVVAAGVAAGVGVEVVGLQPLRPRHNPLLHPRNQRGWLLLGQGLWLCPRWRWLLPPHQH